MIFNIFIVTNTNNYINLYFAIHVA